VILLERISEESTEGCKEVSHMKNWMKEIMFWLENIPNNKNKNSWWASVV
jgi:hypothetical protein